jgi:hypothetical protein
MKVKPLPSRKYLRQCLQYGPQDGSLIWRADRPRIHFATNAAYGSWLRRFGDRPAGCINRSNGRWRIKISCQVFDSSRVIVKWMTGVDPVEVDHRDKDRLNLRWPNLRRATRDKNLANRAVRSDNMSGVKGVRLLPGGSVMARVGQTYLGVFPTLEGAHAAYFAEAKRRWGSFASG